MLYKYVVFTGIHCFYCLVESRCTPLPVWQDLEVNTTIAVHGVSVNIKCKEGSLWIDGITDPPQNATLITCSHRGTWTPGYPTCQGTCTYINVTWRLKGGLVSL